jgi:WD40 repeat protein
LLALRERDDVRVFQIPNQEEIAHFNVPSVPRLPVAFSSAGRFMAIPTEQSAVEIWDLQARSIRNIIQGSQLSYPVFSPDGNLLFTSDFSGIYAWDVTRTNERRKCLTFGDRSGILPQAVISSDGTLLASVVDEHVLVWELTAVP